MFHKFLKLYSRYGLLDTESQKLEDLLLHETCRRRHECWSEADQERMSQENKVQLPFIGPRYNNSAARLAVIGTNLNESGGLFEVQQLCIHAQFLISNGWKKIRFGNPPERYSGGLFWHRLAAYAAVICSISDLRVSGDYVEVGGMPLLSNPSLLADAMGEIAFLELIKCSPRGERSKPSDQMWNLCPREFLLEELSLLRPTILLTMGIKTGRALRYILSDVKELTPEDSSGMLAVARLAGRTIIVVSVPHPASPGGSADSCISHLAACCIEKSAMFQLCAKAPI